MVVYVSSVDVWAMAGNGTVQRFQDRTQLEAYHREYQESSARVTEHPEDIPLPAAQSVEG